MRLRRLLMVTGAGAGLIALAGGGFVALHYLQEPRPGPPPRPAATRDDRWRQDLQYLARELPRLHANAFHTISRASFDSAVAAILENISELDDGAIQVRIAQLLARIGDGHTSSSPRPNREATYPLRFRGYKDGLVVVRTGPGLERFLGARLQGIDSLPIAPVLERVATVVSRDDSSTIRIAGPGYLSSPTVLHALGVVQTRDSASFLLDTGNGDSTRLVLRPVTLGPTDWRDPPTELPLYLRRPQDPFWMEYLASSQTAYVRYRHCVDPIGFWRLSRQLRQVLATHPGSRVVVDFRGNPGGNSFQFHYLMMPVLEDTLLTPPGRLLALVDGATFSSASTNVHQLRMTAKVQLIGESPGGLAGGYGEVRPLRLPNSQITVWYASRYFPLDTVLSPDGRIDVDREIQPSMADYLGGVDPVLAAALASPGN